MSEFFFAIDTLSKLGSDKTFCSILYLELEVFNQNMALFPPHFRLPVTQRA